MRSTKGFVHGSLYLWALILSLLLVAAPVRATYIGGEPYCFCIKTCSTCQKGGANGPSGVSTPGGDSTLSLTRGNLHVRCQAATARSTFGATLDFSLAYNSYMADGSKAQVDAGIGYGWTHSYNVLLFSQRGNLFRMDGEGAVTQYLSGPNPTTFVSTASWFETLTANPNGTYTLTQKDQTRYTFAAIPNDPLLIAGPVLRLVSVEDREANLTTLTYANGLLDHVTDTYGRTLQFQYNAQSKLSSVTDPIGRVTQFQYDATGRKLQSVTDPTGKTTQYSYNTLYQITRKMDRDGRVFTYLYNAQRLPFAIQDGSGKTLVSLTNPSNWATDRNALALNLMRVYVPSTTTQADGRGNLTRYDYNQFGYVTRMVAPDGSTTTYSYDPTTLQVASTTDASGHTTSYTYDAQGNVLTSKDALGHVTTFTYEPVFNRMTSMTDPNGRTTTYTIDPANGNRTGETVPIPPPNTRSWTYDVHGNVLTSTDRRGNVTSYQYDANGNRSQITDPLPPPGSSVTTMTYDTVGNMLSRTDQNSHTTSYAYDALNRMITMTDPLGFVTQTFYDGEGNVVKIIDANGHPTTYAYDVRRRLLSVTDAQPRTTTYAYDGNDNRTSMTDRNGHTTVYAYDALNRMIKTTDALNEVTSTTYDGVGNKLSQTDANGHTTFYAYDALNRLSRRTDPVPGPNGQPAVTTFQYDMTNLPGAPECTGPTLGSSLVTQQTDCNGKVTYIGYDGLDRQTRVVRKVGPTNFGIADADALTTTTYDPDDNRVAVAVRIIAGTDLTTTSVYDALSRRTQETNPAGDVTRWQYDDVGNVVKLFASNGNITSYTYDAKNELKSVTDSVGPVASYSYDKVGNRLTQADGDGNTTAFAYDSVNRTVQATDALGKSSLYAYDAEGNLTKATDRNGHVTTYAYNEVNRRIQMTDGLGNLTGMDHTTLYAYDFVGNLRQITDANGHSTAYGYDGLNRRTDMVYCDGSQSSFTYDGVGNMLTRTDQNMRVTSYAYDDLYRLTQRSSPPAVDTFTYDLAFRTLTADRNGWLVTFQYDGANRITNTTQGGQTLSYAYDIPGRTRTLTYPGGRVVTEHTDPRARLDTIGDAASPTPITAYQYDFANNVLDRAYRNGAMMTASYDADNRVLQIDHTIGMQRIVGFTYGYDNEGNKLFEGKLHNPPHSEAYAYDAINRLVDYRIGPPGGMATSDTAYDLDPVGNWLQKITNGVLDGRNYNCVNEITGISINGAPLTNPTYDADGNLLTDNHFNYAYDEENRLISLADNTGMQPVPVAAYQYDAFGRRVVKRTLQGTPKETHYFYDDRRVIEEQDASSATQATYVYGNYVDELLTMDRGGQTSYYHQNALYSPHALTNGQGVTAEGYEYDVYGRQTVFAPGPNGVVDFGGDDIVTVGGSSGVGNPYLFTGRELDAESNLYNYRARYDDTGKGRFLQRDPLGYVDGMNLYEYAQSNPTDHVDPFGLSCCCKRIIIKDAPRGGGIGGIGLGAVAQDNIFSYGFDVRVEATVANGEKISDCEIKQWIFALRNLWDNNWNQTVNFLRDGSHGAAHNGTSERVSNADADAAARAWTGLRETFAEDMNNSDFFPSQWWNNHGDDWVEWSDAPGWGQGGARNSNSRLSATDFKYVRQYLTVKVVCKGTDGKSITAQFWIIHSASSRNNAWQVNYTGGPHPALPRTWQ